MEASANSPVKKRKFKNFYINPRYQLNHALMGIGATVVSCGIMAQLVIRKINWSFQTLAAGNNPTEVMKELIFSVVTYFGITAVICGIAILFISVIHTHRVFGSIYAVERYIRTALEKGYSGVIHMRKGHQLGDLPDLVSDLAAKTKK